MPTNPQTPTRIELPGGYYIERGTAKNERWYITGPDKLLVAQCVTWANHEAFAAAMQKDAMRDQQAWLPIKSAPKDGTEVLICHLWSLGDKSPLINTQTATWMKIGGKEGWWPTQDGSRVMEAQGDWGTDYKLPEPATHWMPLPPPPSETQGAE